MSKHQKSSREYNASPLVIRNGFVIMVIMSLVMMITNPTIDRYISTVIQTPKTEINRSDAFIRARQQTCLLDPTLSTLERTKCEELVTQKRSFMKDFLDSHVQRSDWVLLSYFQFPLASIKPSEPIDSRGNGVNRTASIRADDLGDRIAGKAVGIFNRFFFGDDGGISIAIAIVLIYLVLFAYFGLNSIKLFVLKQRN